jgi:hypothetical protein
MFTETGDTKQPRAGDAPKSGRKPKKLSARKLAKAAADPRISPLQRDFEKRLVRFCDDARVCFAVLRMSAEQLREHGSEVDYKSCVERTKNAKSLCEMIETAEWRFAEIVLRGGRDPAYWGPVDFRFR